MSTEEVVYVSWGGNGRGLALREAFEAALERGVPLVYLAILDDDHFGDLDTSYLNLVIDELEWLLDTQLRLVANSLDAKGHAARFMVRAGPVYAVIADVVETSGAELVLIPDEVAASADAVSRAAGVPVEVVFGSSTAG